MYAGETLMSAKVAVNRSLLAAPCHRWPARTEHKIDSPLDALEAALAVERMDSVESLGGGS